MESKTDFINQDTNTEGSVHEAALARMAELQANPPTKVKQPSRPTGNEPENVYLSAEGLQKKQAAWDQAERVRVASADVEASIATRKADRVKAEADHLAAMRANAQREALEPARRAYLASGGSEAEWEKARDEIVADIRKERAVRAVREGQTVTSLVSKLGA